MVPAKYSARNKRAGRLVLGLICVPPVIGAIVAILIYNYQDAITPIVDSYDFCDNDSVLGVSGWIFPKLISHCKAIYFTYLKDHSSADIAIIIDVYIVLCFFVFLATSAYCFLKLPIDSSNPLTKRLMTRPWTFWGYFAGGIAFSCFSIIFIFIDPKLVDLSSSRTRFLATFSTSWGLGPMLQVFVYSMMGGYSIAATILFVRVRIFWKK